MKCPVVTKCCFCVPLRKGVLIFGYINLIFSLLCLPILIFLAVEGMTTHDIFEKVQEEGGKVHLNLTIAFMALDVVMTSILLFGVHKVGAKFSLLCLPILIFLAVEGMTTHDIFEKVHEEGGKVHLNLTIAFMALDVVMTSILLFGVHKKKKNILKVYLYTGLVLQTLPLFIDVIFYEANTALEIFAYFFEMGLNYYLLFLVYQLIYTAEEPAPGMQFTNHIPKSNTNLYV